MVDAFNTAVSGKADGIAVSLVDPSAFNDPVEKALAAGIPAVSYNADAKGNKRLCYIGQDLFESGKALGRRIVEAVGEGEVAGFISTPGQLNIQPRMDGAREAIKEWEEYKPRRDRHPASRQRRTVADSGVLCGASRQQGHVRCGCRQHRRSRKNDGGEQTASKGNSRR